MRFLKLILKAIPTLAVVLTLALLVYLNVKLHYKAKFYKGINADVLAQLHYLEKRKANGAASQMQDLYPEGAMFFNCLYTLSWLNLVEHMDKADSFKRKVLKKVDTSINEIISDKARYIFDPSLPLPYGAYYCGWSTYVLGKRLAIGGLEEDSFVHYFQKSCVGIAKAYTKSNTPYLESYSNACWPADNSLCMASLALHDRIFRTNKYQKIIKPWLRGMQSNLDDDWLIPHSVYANTGESLETARGASMGLTLYFLAEIDTAVGLKIYKRFKEHFVQSRFFLKAIREYPKDKSGLGSIDSGPIIWDIGTAATLVTPICSHAYGDFKLTQQLQNGIETLGMPWTSKGEKKYLGGYLDMADVFIAWTRSKIHAPLKTNTLSWSWPFHLLSLVLASLLFLLLHFIWKPAKRVSLS